MMMSNIDDSKFNQTTLITFEGRDGVNYEISPVDNIYYLPHNIDIRICPKNGLSTLKNVMEKLAVQEGTCDHQFQDFKTKYRVGNYKWRYWKTQLHADGLDLPFRKNSFRVAVRRDPVERFKSACSFIQEKRSYYLRKGRYHEMPVLDDELDKVIEKMYNGTIKDGHFYTQTWYMGNVKDYDMVVNLNDMSQLLSFLMETCNIHNDITNLHLNKTKIKLFDDSISKTHDDKIRALYKKDYDNGWGDYGL